MIPILLALTTLGGGPSEKIGRFDHPKITEPSGIVASRKHPGILWVHNDSGNAPSLFAVRTDGTLVREYAVDAPNLDWEDLAIDDAGHLYIADIGNNLRALPVRAIYRIDEPDPTLRPSGKARLKVSMAIYFTYPKSGPFDAESLFIDGDTAVIVAKTGGEKSADLYAFPLQATSLLRPVVVKKIGDLKGFNKPATGADLSADKRMLAVCALGEVRLYRRDADDRWLPLGKMKGPSGQVEAIAWSGMDLILANEDRQLFRISEKAWRDEMRKKDGKP